MSTLALWQVTVMTLYYPYRTLFAQVSIRKFMSVLTRLETALKLTGERSVVKMARSVWWVTVEIGAASV